MDADLIRHRLQLGLAARRVGQSAEAEANLVAAVSAARESGDPALLSQALAGLAQLERDRGQPANATAHFAEALALARAHTDPLQAAHIARHLGDLLLDHNEPDRAETYLREAIAIERADPCTPQLELAHCLRTLGRLESVLGNADEARALLTESRVIYNALEITAGATDCDERIAALIP